MRILVLSVLFFSAAAAHADCTPQAGAWITLEVVASEAAGREPVELIDIDRAGCVGIRYASFDRRAGLYRRQLTQAEKAALASELDRRAILRFDSEAVRGAIATREQQLRRGQSTTDAEYFHVADGDTVRLSVDDPAGAVQIEWHAPRQLARRHPDVTALSDLVGLIQSLQALAASDAKTRIGDATP